MSAPALKYEEEITSLSLSISCPTNGSKQVSYDKVYRFVANSPSVPKDYEPQSISRILKGNKPPARVLESNNEVWLCEEWGLSMYTSLKHIKAFVQGNPHWKKRNSWNYIAAGPISPSDGVCTDPDHNTHFNLFEYRGANLCTKFAVIETT